MITRRTFGVEEELLLVDAVAGTPTPSGDAVVADAERQHPAAPQQIEHEFKREQVETGSVPCETVDALGDQLRGLRRDLAAAAARSGAQVAAMATSPLKVRPQATDDERYLRMTAAFGAVAEQQLTCGQHVHVLIADAEEGVAVLDRIRGWLAVLVAVSANSPYFQGRDTGYASYRTLLWGMWPSAGPTELFGTPEAYEALIASLVTSGSSLDDAMIYFDARLSRRYPTLEIRVADVCTDVDDALLVAALSRALVDWAAGAARAGIAAPPLRSELLRGMAWRAARWGLAGDLVDPGTGRPAPAWTVVDALVELVGPSLTRNGDLGFVRDRLAALRAGGGGADRQRAAFAERGELLDVVRDAVRRTLE